MKYEPTHPMTQDLGTAMEREDGAALESGGWSMSLDAIARKTLPQWTSNLHKQR